MARLPLLAALSVVVLFAPAALAADEATQVERIECYPNFETASVYVFFTGDSNANGSAALEYREAGGQWRQGHPLSCVYGNQWTGSMFWLSPATAYDVRVTISDPDGVDKATVEGSFTTRDDQWPTGSGKSIYVAVGGKGDGTEEAPLGSIQSAVDMAGPGDTVVITPGVYRESVIVKNSGTSDAYILIKGQPGAVLDGSDPGFLDREAPERWTRARGGGRGAASNYVADCDFPVYYLALDDEKLCQYKDLESMTACRSVTPGGWYQDLEAGKLYVHTTRAFCSPNGRKTVVGRLSTGLDLQGQYIIVDGLEVRYFGTYSIHIDASNNVIQGCNVHHHNIGIYFYDKTINNTTIQNNKVYQTSVWHWPWRLPEAARSYDVDNIGARAGRGTVIRGNEVYGSYDGIGLSVWETLEEPGWMQDTDVYRNYIHNCGDDGCEPEGTCVNLRFWNNRVRRAMMVMSIAPVTVGPAYFINETYYNGELGVLKLKFKTSGKVFLYNCSFYSDGYRKSVWDYGGPWKNITFRNCIFSGTNYAFYDSGPSKEGTVSFDYDCLYTTLPDRLVRWEGVHYPTLAEFQGAGYETHGICADPMWVAPKCGDFNLQPGSPCIDRGLLIPGINDNYVGEGPDIGSHEFGR